MKDSSRALADRVPRSRRTCRREPVAVPRRRAVWVLASAAGFLVFGVVLACVLCAGGTDAPASQDRPAADTSAKTSGPSLPDQRAEAAKPLPATATKTPPLPAEVTPTLPVAYSQAPAPAPPPAAPERKPEPPAPADAAPAVKPAALPEPPEPPGAQASLKRIHDVTEEDLRKQLLEATEIGLGGTASRVLKAHIAALQRDMSVEMRTNLVDATPLLRVRPDLRSLPYRHGPVCQLPPAAARTLGTLAPTLHAYIDLAAPPGRDGRRTDAKRLHDALQKEVRGKRPVWLRAEAIPTMMQLLMHEDTPLRLMLVELLTRIDDSRSSVALARRAVFDLSAEVRQAAVEALKKRRPEDSRPLLLQALRYPWAPAAEHAAEALAALHDRKAVPHLVVLLGQPDPTLPVALDKTRTAVRELVRADHLKNCLMCHAPSLNGKEPVLGPDPNLTIPVKRGEIRTGGGGWGQRTPIPGRAPLLIRADITYLRQDFSVQLPTPVAGGALQQNRRFDFVVRTRLVPRKTADQLRKEAGDRPTYAQRDAVLFALRELTGKDAGERTEAWQKLFPRAAVDVVASRLSGELLQAPAVRREQLLAKLRDDEGTGFTEAIAEAIPRLKGDFQEKARDALVRRLSRLRVEALRARLQDEDAEIRLAAGRASLERGDRIGGASVRQAAEYAERRRQAEKAQLEKKAATHLAYVKKLLQEGKSAAAKERLDTIVRDFLNTPSAQEARRLREELTGK